MCGWGSIPAQWDGGRVLDPPLRSPRKGVCLCAGPDAFTPVPRAAQCAAPTKYGERSVLFVGAGPRPARGRTLCAPTAESGLGALVRQTQAQKRNRISPNFPPAQGPVARTKPHPSTPVLRAGNVLPTSRGNPVTGVRGKRSYGPRRSASGAVVHRPRPRRRFGDFAAVGKVTRRPQAAKLPCVQQMQSETCPLIRPLRGHLTLSPLAFGHLPLTRGVGPQGEGLEKADGEISLRPSIHRSLIQI